MTISSIANSGSTQQQQAIKAASVKLQAAIQSIVSGQRDADVASLSIASQLQSQTSGLKVLSGNIAQASSLSQVADGGAQQIRTIVDQLASLAQAAKSPTLNADNRKQLNEQFQQLKASISDIAKNTTFNGKALLDGSLSGDTGLSLDTLLSGSGGSNDLSIANLTSISLLGNSDILSVDSADKAIAAITQAQISVTSTRSDIGSFLQTLDFASANLDTAIANFEAAQSTLSETDLAQSSTSLSLADLQRNASIALAAQGNKLSPVLLRLIA